jgi:hypothetical protein
MPVGLMPYWLSGLCSNVSTVPCPLFWLCFSPQ